MNRDIEPYKGPGPGEAWIESALIRRLDQKSDAGLSPQCLRSRWFAEQVEKRVKRALRK